MGKGGKIAATLLLVGAVIAGRLLPHPWNFTPLIGAVLAGGAYLGRRHAAVIALASLTVTDVALGTYDWRLMVVVYAFSVLVVLPSGWIKKGNRPVRTVAAAVSTSFVFFLATNFAVWAFSSWYPHDFGGLIRCYWSALPFFRNSLTGDLFYSTVFCLVFEVIESGLWTRALSRLVGGQKAAARPTVYT